MRWLIAVSGACALSACGILSGLDSLTTSDGGADVASMDVTTSDTGSSDGGADQNNDVIVGDGGTGTDASSDADAGSLCAYTGGNPGCFGAVCTGGGTTCCLHDSGPECAATCTGIELACTTPSDCTDAAPNCCLSASFSGVASCPVLLGPGTMTTGSTCSSLFCSAPLQGKARVCTTNADCPGMNKCVQAAFASNPTLVFGVCE